MIAVIFLLTCEVDSKTSKYLQKPQACEMLIAIDGPLYEKFNSNMYEVNEYVQDLVEELNQIFHANVFTENYSEIYFRVKEIRLLSGFCPNCLHGTFDNRCTSMHAGNYFLSEFSKMDTKNFCIAHLLTDKQFVNSNTIFSGFSNKRSICGINNTGFTVIDGPSWFKNSRKLAAEFAHKIAHNFGAEHGVGVQILNATKAQ